MITCPPLTAFFVVVTKINRDMGRGLGYRTGRTGYLIRVILVCLWLWLVLIMIPQMSDLLASLTRY